MTDPMTYLDRTLAKYARYYDITENYSIGGRTYPAYGYYFSQNEKYVATRKVNLWTVKTYEHVLFIIEKTCTQETLDTIRHLITDEMEPNLVRHGQKYPEKDHMSSQLSFVVICEETPSDEIIRAARKFSYDRGYLFSMRGYARGGLILVDLASERVWTNGASAKAKKNFEKTFQDLREGKKGYHELFAADGEEVPSGEEASGPAAMTGEDGRITLSETSDQGSAEDR